MAVKTIIQDFVTSELDHGNCSLYEAPSSWLPRLQNYAARINTHVRK